MSPLHFPETTSLFGCHSDEGHSKNGTNYAKPKQKFEKRGEFRRKFESDNGKKSMNPDVIYGRDLEEESMEIEKIDGPIGEVVIRGTILSVDTREIRN